MICEKNHIVHIDGVARIEDVHSIIMNVFEDIVVHYMVKDAPYPVSLAK